MATILKQQKLSDMLGVSLTLDLGKYLEMSIIHSEVKKETYKEVLEKVKRRLYMWKVNSLLIDRVTLVQSVISMIPVYSMKMARLPRSVCDEIEKASRGFIWGQIKRRGRVI